MPPQLASLLHVRTIPGFLMLISESPLFKPGKHFPRSSPSRLIFTDRSRKNIRDTGQKNNDLDKTTTPNLKVKEAKEKVEVTVPCTTSDCKPGGGAGIGKDGDVRWKRDIPVNCRLVSL